MATPNRNQPPVFFESMAAMRAAERRLAESQLFPQNLLELQQVGYMEAYICPAGDGFIDHVGHAFTGVDGRLYHSRDCADMADLEGL